MLNRLRSFLGRFRRNTSGLSALEFSFIAPVMITSLIGAVEVSNGMLADRKVTQTTSTVADLVAQKTSINSADLASVFNAAETIMAPMDTSGMGIRVTSVVAAANGVPRVRWSRGRNMAARPNNSVVTIPPNVLTAGESLILAEVSYPYTSELGRFITDGITMSDRFFLKPRRSVEVTWTN